MYSACVGDSSRVVLLHFVFVIERVQRCRAKRIQLRSSRSIQPGSRCPYHISVASSYTTSLYDSNYVAVNSSLNSSMMTNVNASMMTGNMNIMTDLYNTGTKIEPVEVVKVLSIHWCTSEVNSYKIMFLTPYSVSKLFDFQVGYITSAMVSVDMCEIHLVLWEQGNKVCIFSNCMSK